MTRQNAQRRLAPSVRRATQGRVNAAQAVDPVTTTGKKATTNATITWAVP